MTYDVGSIIEYSTWGGSVRRILVEDKEDDIKNGRPGFSGKCVNPNTNKPYEQTSSNGVWGYDSQITRVIR